MFHPAKLLWGFLPLLLLTLVTYWAKAGAIQDDLASRTNVERRAEGHRWARVEMDGRDMSLSGVAPTEADRSQMMEIAAAVWGVRQVSDNIELLEIVDPYTWSAERTDRNIILTGYAPNRATRKSIVDAAKAVFPDLRVKNELEYGRGAPENFETATVFAFTQLGHLQEGSVTLSNQMIAFSGRAANFEGYNAARAVIDNPELPAGFALGDSSISRPIASPFVFSVARTGRDIQLSGFAPSEEGKANILAAVARKFPNFSINDQIDIADGAPEGWRAIADFALQQISRLVSGEAIVTDAEIAVSGEAVHQGAIDGIVAGLSDALPSGFSGTGEIMVAAPGAPLDLFACQDLFNEVMGSEKILFDVGEATISLDSLRVIDEIVAVALRCPNGKMAILGHTDDDGDDDSNQNLSEVRADSVRNAMITGGISDTRLTAIGYGESRPVASNDTEEGKAANRRIEFRVVRIQY